MSIVRIALALLLAVAGSAANAHIDIFGGTLAPELPGATGSGSVAIQYEDEISALTINASFSGLSGTVTQSHIHCCQATPGTGNIGVALGNPSLTGFPLGVSAGNFSHTFDLTVAGVYGGAFLNSNGGVSGAKAALLQGLRSGTSYLNIHTSTFPSGEIRASITPVPEPGTYALMLAGFGLLGLAAARKRRNR